MKTIFFDNDGTLVDTEKLYFKAVKAILKKVGVEVTHEWFIEFSLKKNISSWTLLKDLKLSDSEIKELRKMRNDYYSELLASETELIPGVKETLEKLYGKVKMAVVTTSHREHFEIILSKTGIAKYFDFCVVNEDVKNEKPHPEPYLLALSISKNRPENCIAIEDTERGLIAAKKAGIACYVIPTELSKSHDFSESDGILKTFADIPELTFLASTVQS
ncbi:MAG: HAD family phosphatase [Patescibacteria group bacterium]